MAHHLSGAPLLKWVLQPPANSCLLLPRRPGGIDRERIGFHSLIDAAFLTKKD